MSCDCGCCSDCCPAIVPVTVENNEISIDEGALEITVNALVPADATRRRINIQVQDDDGNDVPGGFLIRMWFVDAEAATDVRTAIPPDDPGVADIERVTNADGLVSFIVQNAVLSTWYLNATLGAGVTISPAITIGV